MHFWAWNPLSFYTAILVAGGLPRLNKFLAFDFQTILLQQMLFL